LPARLPGNFQRRLFHARPVQVRSRIDRVAHFAPLAFARSARSWFMLAMPATERGFLSVPEVGRAGLEAAPPLPLKWCPAFMALPGWRI
jgi:hypothetical protein